MKTGYLVPSAWLFVILSFLPNLPLFCKVLLHEELHPVYFRMLDEEFDEGAVDDRESETQRDEVDDNEKQDEEEKSDIKLCVGPIVNVVKDLGHNEVYTQQNVHHRRPNGVEFAVVVPRHQVNEGGDGEELEHDEDDYGNDEPRDVFEYNEEPVEEREHLEELETAEDNDERRQTEEERAPEVHRHDVLELNIATGVVRLHCVLEDGIV